ncbi:hypothetical protein JK182_08250 [Acetobacter okinawensis]|uniref:hypothetical protein n=1 Tax=Acetobacter okinawensis TaxID=1076594 RepID=UPI001BAA9AD8|nr:hypothetical protein [Acetobacter okinawensis]MBS0988655.1 hypothetical protein [Acetobacter okinawensis]
MTQGISFLKMRLPLIEGADLTATQYDSAEEKAKLGNAILGFIAKGMPHQSWNKRLYHQVSNMWGFIAHYNRECFGARYFNSTEGRISFLETIERAGCHGSPRWTWCDVEVIIQRRVKDARLSDAYRLQERQDIEQHERAQLAFLMAKYHTGPETSSTPVIAQPQPCRSRQLSLI